MNPNSTDPAPPLAGVLMVHELEKQPSHPADLAAENEALLTLAAEISQNRNTVLQTLARLARKLCRADSAGISLLEGSGQEATLKWEAVAGSLAGRTGTRMARQESPCSMALERNHWLLFREPGRFFTSFSHDSAIHEALVVPFQAEDAAVGTLWVIARDPEIHFDAEDVRLLTNLSNFACVTFGMMKHRRTEIDLRASRAAALNLMEDAVITRRQLEQANEALRTSEEQFRRAIEEAPIPVILQAEDGEVLQLSKTWIALTGYHLQDLPTLDAWMRLAYGEGGEDLKRHVRELFAGGAGMDQIEFEIVTRQGDRRRWLFSASPVGQLHDGRHFIVGMALDMTERIQSRATLEAALAETQRAKQEAEKANRIKDQFLAILSHELRTPLMPVLTAAESLLRRKDLPPIVVEGLQMICRNVELENHFINDLLDITRISRGKLELVLTEIDLHHAIESAIEISKPELEGKGQKLVMELGAKRPVLQGDFARVQQVFWNVLKNASKFTPEGGTIRVRSWTDNGSACASVSDSGIGIAPEALPQIFDAFRQADTSIMRRFGGLGLGLAIAKAAVDAHGGEITAASAGMGKGATLTIRLPLHKNTG